MKEEREREKSKDNLFQILGSPVPEVIRNNLNEETIHHFNTVVW